MANAVRRKLVEQEREMLGRCRDGKEKRGVKERTADKLVARYAWILDPARSTVQLLSSRSSPEAGLGAVFDAPIESYRDAGLLPSQRFLEFRGSGTVIRL